MTVPAAETERRLSVLSEALRSSGLRLTHQRLEVARELAGDDTHPDVESIYRGVRERVPTVSLDTVYRTVAALVEMGLVSRVDATAGADSLRRQPRPASPLRVHALRVDP